MGGYLFKHMTEGAFDRSGRRLLGIRIDKFSFAPGGDNPFDFPITVTLMNAGGWRNGDSALNGCSVHFSSERQGSKWLVRWGRIGP